MLTRRFLMAAAFVVACSGIQCLAPAKVYAAEDVDVALVLAADV